MEFLVIYAKLLLSSGPLATEKCVSDVNACNIGKNAMKARRSTTNSLFKYQSHLPVNKRFSSCASPVVDQENIPPQELPIVKKRKLYNGDSVPVIHSEAANGASNMDMDISPMGTPTRRLVQQDISSMFTPTNKSVINETYSG